MGFSEQLARPNLCFKIILAAVQKMVQGGGTMETHCTKHPIGIHANPTIDPILQKW